MIIKTLKAGLFAAALALGLTFIQTPVTTPAVQVEAASFEWGTVNSSTPLNVRKAANSKAKVLGSYKKGTKVKCYTTGTTWVKVTIGATTGYVNGKYVTTAYGTASQPYKNVRKGTVNTATLAIRKSASSSSSTLATVSYGDSVQVLTSDATWVKIKASGVTGYVYGKYITITATGKTAAGTTVSTSSSSSTTGAAVVAYAKKFLGNKYVYGGTSLTNGTDCSGFTMRIYEHFGYSLPRTSAAQRSSGTKVASLSAAQPGDLICYSGHVAIYMGNNMIIHASNAKDGIKISYNASYRTIVSIRRIIK